MSSPEDRTTQSTSFELLHRSVQRWIYDNDWRSIRDAQERAIPLILAGDADVIISAPTADGKTEAVFLPVLSKLAASNDTRHAASRQVADRSSSTSAGIEVLCISPLKALINDQFSRLERMGECCDVEVHRWHGDVSASRKKRTRDHGSGILIITPESLEAMMVNRGHELKHFFRSLRYIVVDELHAFFGTPRGAQLQSLLNRVDLAIRRQPPRIGLSATIGDTKAAAEFLRPGGGSKVEIVRSSGPGFELKLQLRGFLEASDAEQNELTRRLMAAHRGHDGLIFANAVTSVETLSASLAEESRIDGVPNEFFPHHGRLSKELREDVEHRLCDINRPTTAVCTSTLELGIDVGSIKTVSQVGTPPTVSALRQRMGRCRNSPAILRLYNTEQPIDVRSPIRQRLREGLVQTIALMNLLLRKWFELPSDPGFNYSTLVQQTLSTIAQHGGAREKELHSVLCGRGPFGRVTEEHFAILVETLIETEMLARHEGGILLHGRVGEREVNHYNFYAAFHTPDEWRLISGSVTLGTIVKTRLPPTIGNYLLFAGRRWLIVRVDDDNDTIELARAGTGTPSPSMSTIPDVADEVRSEMLSVYQGMEPIGWLDKKANDLLTEARHEFHLLDLGENLVTTNGNSLVISPWLGDRVLTTLTVLFGTLDIDLEQEGPCLLAAGQTIAQLGAAATTLSTSPYPSSGQLGLELLAKAEDKWDSVVATELLAESLAIRHLDLQSATSVLHEITAQYG